VSAEKVTSSGKITVSFRLLALIGKLAGDCCKAKFATVMMSRQTRVVTRLNASTPQRRKKPFLANRCAAVFDVMTPENDVYSVRIGSAVAGPRAAYRVIIKAILEIRVASRNFQEPELGRWRVLINRGFHTLRFYSYGSMYVVISPNCVRRHAVD
jgi:hypothetical protein